MNSVVAAPEAAAHAARTSNRFTPKYPGVRVTCNGNTLVTTMDMPGKVIQFDSNGTEVWSYQAKGNTKITRALRR